MRSFFRFLSVLLTLTWCGQSLRAADSVPMKVLHGLPIVSLRINGQGPYELLLDTGTQSTLVDQGLARDLRLTIVDRTQLITPNGTHPVGRAVAETVTVGHRKLANVEFLVDELRELHSVDGKLRGILGQDVLTRFNFLLDYRNRRVEFEPEAKESGIELHFDLQDGRIIVSAEIDGTRKLKLLLDSGASDLMLFRSPKDSNVQPCRAALLSTNHSTSEVREAILRELRMGTVALRHIRVGFTSTSTLTEINGLMPTNLFDSIYFDFGRRRIVVVGKDRI